MKVDGLDEMLGIPARMAIVATLATLPTDRTAKQWTFTALGAETGLADGNLHVQTRKLIAAGYVHAQRTRLGNRKVTCFSLTEKGRHALRAQINILRDALAGGSGMRTSSVERPSTPEPVDDSQVW